MGVISGVQELGSVPERSFVRVLNMATDREADICKTVDLSSIRRMGYRMATVKEFWAGIRRGF